MRVGEGEEGNKEGMREREVRMCRVRAGEGEERDSLIG
jgi:hypothetical protein